MEMNIEWIRKFHIQFEYEGKDYDIKTPLALGDGKFYDYHSFKKSIGCTFPDVDETYIDYYDDEFGFWSLVYEDGDYLFEIEFDKDMDTDSDDSAYILDTAFRKIIVWSSNPDDDGIIDYINEIFIY